MTNDEALHVYGRSDRPSPTRCRTIPVVPMEDTRPSDWAGLAKMLAVFGFGAFALGLIGGALWLLL